MPPAGGRQGQDFSGHFCSGGFEFPEPGAAAINRLYMLLTVGGGALMLR